MDIRHRLAHSAEPHKTCRVADGPLQLEYCFHGRNIYFYESQKTSMEVWKKTLLTWTFMQIMKNCDGPSSYCDLVARIVTGNTVRVLTCLGDKRSFLMGTTCGRTPSPTLIPTPTKLGLGVCKVVTCIKRELYIAQKIDTNTICFCSIVSHTQQIHFSRYYCWQQLRPWVH